MATYNRALDLMALATHELSKGNVVNASTLLQRAAAEPSLHHALRMVEATNNHAAQVQAAAAKKAPKVVKANPEFEDTDNETMSLLNQENANGQDDQTHEGDEPENDADGEEEFPVTAKTLAAALTAVLKAKK